MSLSENRQSKRYLLLVTVLIAGLMASLTGWFFLSSGMSAIHSSSGTPGAFVTPPILEEARVWYRVRGTGVVTINGPGCCEGANFPGTFEMDYRPRAGGRIEITRLQTTLADMNLTFRFLIFASKQLAIYCGEMHNDRAINADVDSASRLTIPAGAVTVSGAAFEKRNARGQCSGANTDLTATNNSPIRGVLDPGSNHVGLAGAFTTRIEGNDYTLTLEMNGAYANRPPRARFGVSGRNLEPFAQGGCPAILNSGNPPELVVEANDRAGLKMSLRSHSYDPDGSWDRADLDLNKWFYARDTGPLNYLGEGLEYGPMTFAFGPRHRLVLETSDRMGAATNDDCSFRVVDSTPPSVTPPVLISIPATFRGGAKVRNSAALRAFLNGANCIDMVDPAPIKLPPLFAGAAVTNETVFPIGYSTVTFRCRDGFGNNGTAESRVKVTAAK